MTDYKEKIANLLKLAESSNEYEARDALLKARRLMAKHKISELDLEDRDDEKVVHELTGITYSKRRDPWISDLARTIASHHCCQETHLRERRKL